MLILTRRAFTLLSISFLCNCGVPKSKYLEIKSRNEILEESNTELRNRLKEIKYLKEHSQVTLANTELREVYSETIDQRYKIKVFLPRGYNQNSDPLPVLYVTDADTNFGGVSYIVQRLIKDRLIPPMIVVGIAYGTDYKTFYELRSRDLTPVEDPTLKMGGKIDPTGGAPKFCDFLSKELFPIIESEYRVDPNNRSLYGHSYGGLFTSYVLLEKPHLFQKYLILSPSLWFKNEFMLEKADSFGGELQSTRVYLGSGELEGRIDDLQTEFARKLKDKKLAGLSIHDEVFENETHRTIFGPGFTNGMRYLFQESKN